jgi:hypothetical protein
MKKLMLIIAALMLFSIPASAKSIQDIQEDMGMDKIAHATAGMACSAFVLEKMHGKKHSKMWAWSLCSAFAMMKEQSDTKSDPKDFLATEIGIVIPLISIKIAEW